METVTILRELWRRRLLVGLAALGAILLAVLLMFQSRSYEVGLASARILVDTPSSQVVEVAPKGSETLGPRASLLADLMTEGEVKAAIARRAGLRPKQLLAESEVEPLRIPESAKRGPRAHLLTTRLVVNPGGEPLPIIEVEAQAPDVRRAVRLANAAVAGLGAYLDTKAAVESVSDGRRLQVTGLGAPVAQATVRGPSRMMALGAGLFVFLAACAAILAVSRLARGWRVASRQDALDGGGNPDMLFDRPLGDAPLDPHGLDDPLPLNGEAAPVNGDAALDWSSDLLAPLPPRGRS